MTTFSYTTASWELGRRAKMGTNYADITVHYVRWWDGYALSTSDVASLYTNRAIVNYSNWKPVTIPTYDWNFRQALSNGSTVTDQISQETLTLDGPSATVADGASVTQLEDHIDFGDTTITISLPLLWKYTGKVVLRVLTGSLIIVFFGCSKSRI